MTWYGTGLHQRAVHARPNCPRLLRNLRHPIRELPDSYFRVNSLCGTCFTGQVSSLHARCSVCNHKTVTPCPHNGGVQVKGATRLLWVWPEDAISRTLVNPMHVR